MRLCPICLSYARGLLCDKCSKDYLWDRKYKIYRHKCASKSKYKSQHRLYEICKLLYTKVFEEVAFVKCPGAKGALLRFDIYIPEKKILIEFQGREHFEYTRIFHKSQKDFKESKFRDMIKKVFCEKFGYTLIEFYESDKLFPHLVKEKIEQCLKK